MNTASAITGWCPICGEKSIRLWTSWDEGGLRLGRFPPPLQPGDRVKVVSPSSPTEPEAVTKGMEVLKEWGLRPELGRNALLNRGYLAGSDSERLQDLCEALLDPSVRGVFATRGGYGVVRLLDHIPWDDLAQRPPKAFVGFSDLGALQLNLLQRCGWGSFSGLQVANGLGGDSGEVPRRCLWGMLNGTGRVLTWRGVPVQLRPIRQGECGGVLVPICLSILTALIGTPHQPNLDGAVLCVEDVEEAPYRIDRMFWQLEHSGLAEGLAGLVLGAFLWKGENLAAQVHSIAADCFARSGFPIWSGLPYGHFPERLTLPMGAEVKVGDDGVLSLIRMDIVS